MGDSSCKRESPLLGAFPEPFVCPAINRFRIVTPCWRRSRRATRIRNYSTGADCQSTLGAVSALGAGVERRDGEIVIQGRGLDGLQAPAADLDAGNSGSTIRMLSGILAAQQFSSRIFGDESLSRRPMERIMQPLGEMGARIAARDGRFPPLSITGTPLKPIDYTLPVPSAQVKTCVLFAGLYADGATVVHEPIRSRDHTEIALREFGADITVERRKITPPGRPKPAGANCRFPQTSLRRPSSWWRPCWSRSRN